MELPHGLPEAPQRAPNAPPELRKHPELPSRLPRGSLRLPESSARARESSRNCQLSGPVASGQLRSRCQLAESIASGQLCSWSSIGFSRKVDDVIDHAVGFASVFESDKSGSATSAVRPLNMSYVFILSLCYVQFVWLVLCTLN